MTTDYKGYMEQVTTFEADSDVVVGRAVMMKSNGKVKLCTSGKPVGICIALRDGYAAVQTHGYVEVPYTGEISVGVTAVAGSTGGAVAVSESGRPCIAVETEEAYAGIIL